MLSIFEELKMKVTIVLMCWIELWNGLKFVNYTYFSEVSEYIGRLGNLKYVKTQTFGCMNK